MPSTIVRRPELMVLTSAQKSRVRHGLRRSRHVCHGCGERRFIVGDAMYLGFLFNRERTDSYLVALTCDQPGCPAPHGGVRYPRARLFGVEDEPPIDHELSKAAAIAVGTIVAAVAAARSLTRRRHRGTS